MLSVSRNYVDCIHECHRANQCKPPPPKEDINCVAQRRREDDDFRRSVELQICNKNDNFKMDFNALIDSGRPICFVKKCYITRCSGLNNAKSYGVRTRFHEIGGTITKK